MVTPTRYTSQKQQERISRHQFCERLDEFGWVASRPDEDLGEDFLVHIYFDGQATGVTFHVQLKSVTNLEARRHGDFLVYDEIKVKDLKHWEDFSLPVVLVIWDVEQREGRWALIDDVIADLDEQRPQWRKNKTKTRVRIPWANGTDEAGLKSLQKSINQKLFPLLLYKKYFKDISVYKGKIQNKKVISFNHAEKSFDRKFLPYFDKIVIIQNALGRLIHIPQRDLTTDDIRAIDELSEIVERGMTTIRQAKVTGDFDKKALKIMLDVLRQDKPIHLAISSPESFVELFGEEISTGRMTRHITGRLTSSVTNLEHALKTLKPGKTLAVEFQDPKVIEIFPDWYIREAERLSRLLRDRFEIDAIYLFGSLAWGDTWTIETDIDLAIQGLAPERYFSAIGFLERESSFKVDLIQLENAPDYLRQRILSEGKLLYERAPAFALG